jgi:hypothetical protein
MATLDELNDGDWKGWGWQNWQGKICIEENLYWQHRCGAIATIVSQVSCDSHIRAVALDI